MKYTGDFRRPHKKPLLEGEMTSSVNFDCLKRNMVMVCKKKGPSIDNVMKETVVLRN